MAKTASIIWGWNKRLESNPGSIDTSENNSLSWGCTRSAGRIRGVSAPQKGGSSASAPGYTKPKEGNGLAKGKFS